LYDKKSDRASAGDGATAATSASLAEEAHARGRLFQAAPDRGRALVEAGILRSTLTEVAGPIDATHLRKAHALVESGRTRGKIALAGFL
jgi:hypothetical protein